MSKIGDELQRVLDAKTSMRAAILAKEVDVPADVRLDGYPEYILQINSGGGTPQPGVIDFDNLKLALNTGAPGEYFPIGTEIPDTFAGNNNPMIVGTYQTIDGKLGVGLVRKFVEPTSQTFGSSANYNGSTILNYLNSAYLNSCSEALRAVIAEVRVPYSAGGITQVSGKWHLLSGIEVCATYNSGEGQIWEYWKMKTGLSGANNNSSSGRVCYSRGGAAQTWWLRSRGGASGVCGVTNTGSIINFYEPSLTFGVLPICWVLAD